MMSVFFSFLAVTSASAIPADPTVILVDKKTNTLKVAKYEENEYKILKTFHTTMGLVQGDKEEEGDLKTPEGIYFFNALLRPPSLKPKFGVMAFYMNYPNEFDLLAGRTGFDIMLHATNAPQRLKKDFDSEGCIVVKNEELLKIKPFIRLGLTPILVFNELNEQYLKPAADSKIKNFFSHWLEAWSTKKIDSYVESYHSSFTAKGMNKGQWRNYKSNLNSLYKEILIKAEDIQYFRHPKYSVIMFVQNYSSTLKNGRPGFKSRGTKTLVVAEEDGQPRIISEKYTPQTWN